MKFRVYRALFRSSKAFEIQFSKDRNTSNFQILHFLTLPRVIFWNIFTYSGRASSTLVGTSPQTEGGLQIIVLTPRLGGGMRSLGLGKYYHDMLKYFSKSILGNRNFYKVLKFFILWSVEISFFHLLYLRNGASWTQQTLDGQYHNFRSRFQIRGQNFKIR